MAVYVDNMKPCVPNRNWRWFTSCHLTADSIVELHAFAKMLGLRLSWFQTASVLPHYDLTEGKRAQAVKLGAVELDDRAMGERIRAVREGRVPEPKYHELFEGASSAERGTKEVGGAGGGLFGSGGRLI